MTDWSVLLWLAALLSLVLVLKHWLNQHLQGVSLLYSGDEQTAVLIYYLILLPGIVLHELSHLLAAALVGVPAKGFSLRPSAHRGKTIRMASVTVKHTDPVRESWIGIAPLLTGSLCILLLGRWRFGIGLESLSSSERMAQALAHSLRAADAWLWLYLIFAISNAMLPSESDRRPWLPVLLFLALTTVMLVLSGTLQRMPQELGPYILGAFRYLVLAFGLTAVVDVLFAAIILALEAVGERLLDRHVEY